MVADETNEEDEEMIHALAASMEGMKDLRGRTAKDKDVTVIEEEKTCTTHSHQFMYYTHPLLH